MKGKGGHRMEAGGEAAWPGKHLRRERTTRASERRAALSVVGPRGLPPGAGSLSPLTCRCQESSSYELDPLFVLLVVPEDELLLDMR